MKTISIWKGTTFAFLIAIFGAVIFTSCNKEGENAKPKSKKTNLSATSVTDYDSISYESLLGFYKATSIDWAPDSLSCDIYTSITDASLLHVEMDIVSPTVKEVIITNTSNGEVYQYSANSALGILILKKASTLQDLQNQNYLLKDTLLSNVPNEVSFLYKDIDVNSLGEVLANAMFDKLVPTPIIPSPTPAPGVNARRRRYKCKDLSREDCAKNAIAYWEASHPEGWENRKRMYYRGCKINCVKV